MRIKFFSTLGFFRNILVFFALLLVVSCILSTSYVNGMCAMYGDHCYHLSYTGIVLDKMFVLRTLKLVITDCHLFDKNGACLWQALFLCTAIKWEQ